VNIEIKLFGAEDAHVINNLWPLYQHDVSAHEPSLVPNGHGRQLWRTISPADATDALRRPRAMKTYDIRATMKQPPSFVTPDGKASFWIGDPFNGGMISVGRFSGQSPWERHPDGDELVHVLDGEVEITVLSKAGPEEITVRAGSVFVVPKNHWHRQHARQSVTQLGATVGATEHSHAEDPRQDP
jgi:mannose-6-phosphate isomerase-like protein (cupin superfamily)